MLKVLKLSLIFSGEHRTRLALTSSATIAAGILVIWIASGYDALLKTYDEYANLAMGRYTLAVAPIAREGDHDVPAEVLAALRADPATSVVDPMWAFHARVDRQSTGEIQKSTIPSQGKDSTVSDFDFERGPGSGPMARLPESLCLATDASQPPFELAKGNWIAPDNPKGVVARADAAVRLGIDVGDTLLLTMNNRTIESRVIGIVNAPALSGSQESSIPILSPSSGEFFVPEKVALELLQSPARISLIGVSLNPEADLTQFRFGWAPRLSKFATPVQFQEAFEIEEALDQAEAARNVKLQSYAATGVGLLIAFLTILSTLNIGVNERIRQYAILRTISFTRVKIAALIAIEGALLGGIGFFGSILVGEILLQAVGSQFTAILYHGVALGTNSVVLAGIATLGGAILASLIPAWRAMGVRPIEAMAPTPAPFNDRPMDPVILASAVGMIMVNPVLTFVYPPRFGVGVLGWSAVGFIAMSIGFLLIAPAVARFVERGCGPLIARLFGIDYKLLACQLTGHMWRTVATSTILAFGLALLIGIQVWGFTMLEGFVPGTWAPDALISFRPEGLEFDKAIEVASIRGVDSQRCEPIVVEQPRLLHDLTRSAERASVTRQDNIVMVGINPEGAFIGENPLLSFEWVEGNPVDAVAQMREGRACVVPDHFLLESGLKLGDAFSVIAPENPSWTPKYRIVGAVRMPGWHWQTKLTGFRSRTHRAAALVFADIQSVSTDFDLPQASHVWFSYDAKMESINAIEAAAKNIHARALGHPVIRDDGEGREPTARVIPVQEIRKFIRNVARRWIWVTSQLPLIAISIAGLGILNSMLASVRSRSWEFGVMRSLGITGPAIARAILAEGLLIGIMAAILGVGYGMLAGWCGCGIAQYTSFFGGLHPDLIIPWRTIVTATAGVVLLATMAAIWPAVSIGRTRPLVLLHHRQIENS